jgi:putative chitinase
MRTLITPAQMMAAPEQFNRGVYFNSVRSSLFAPALDQGQVDGQNAILTRWEADPTTIDLRHLAYALATTKHETASTMLPIEEYGLGAGMEYGEEDPVTGQTYYGRGFVQLTWRDNYAKSDRELGLTGDKSCEWHAENALNPLIAADIMFKGMIEGWFRGDSQGRQTLDRYFNATVTDAWTAREIINGDKTKVPSWSGGVNIGNLIKGYYEKFLAALNASFTETAAPEPPPEGGVSPEDGEHIPTEPPPQPAPVPRVDITVSGTISGGQVSVFVNGEQVL